MAGSDDTIIALSSGRLPAALGIIRASGRGALTLAATLAGELPKPRQASLRRFVDPASGEEIDRGLLLVFPGPDSATGEDLVEFHLHGSRAVVDAVLAVAASCEGVRMAEPGEFTRRALGNGRLDLIETEGLAELLAAETQLQRRAAQSRAGGDVSRILDQWRQRLLSLSAAAEVAIDYVDEEDGAGAPGFAAGATRLADDIEGALCAPRIDRLRDGFRVVLAGPPNSGKSSLFNNLCDKDRAIVTSTPGTTRDSIEAHLSRDGLPVVLVDTAGLRDSGDDIERLGIERSAQEMADADLILWLGADPPPSAEQAIWLSPKADITTPIAGRLAVSSTTGQGLTALWTAIHHRLRERIPRTGQLAITERESSLLRDVVALLRTAGSSTDVVLASEDLRLARALYDRLIGLSGIDDLLDALFERFCVGK